MTVTNSARKPRRTKVQLEDDLLNGLMRLVEKKGFTNIPLYMITQEAHIDSNVFYRRFDNINELFALLAKRFDLWLGDMVNEERLQEIGSRKFLIELLQRLYVELTNNKVMQKLLIWELSENNEITRHTTAIRQKYNHKIIDHFTSLSEGKSIDMRSTVSFMITGIYYIVLHQEHAQDTIMSLSPSNDNKEIFGVIESFVNLLFDKLERESNLKKSIEKMLSDGLSPEKICNYLDLTIAEYQFITA